MGKVWIEIFFFGMWIRLTKKPLERDEAEILVSAWKEANASGRKLFRYLPAEPWTVGK